MSQDEFGYLSFRLPESFFEVYKTRSPKWGFPAGAGNTLGEHSWLTKYSRQKADGTRERFWEGLRRVIEGTYSIQKDYAITQCLPWSDEQATRSAMEAYERCFAGKWSPPGRGLWMMGSERVNARHDGSALYNCSFLSTAHLTDNPTLPFTRMMDESMLGIGVGFDTLGAGKVTLHEPQGVYPHSVGDSREGWCESLGCLLRSFFTGSRMPNFDYSRVRPAGSPIKGFGGVASGPAPLEKLHRQVIKLLSGRAGQVLTSADIVDIMNMAGKCVVSANVRRSAQIALGMPEDEDFLALKDWRVNPGRMGPDGWGHLSNNSVTAESGDDLSHLADRISLNGEPGIFWQDLAKGFGRLADPRNDKDYRIQGQNPCGEVPLENFEKCVTGETLIHTREGLFPIGNLIGRRTEIWNGVGWSQVTPFHAGEHPVYRVTISDGSYLDVTPGHEWIARRKTERTMKVIRTDALESGMILPEFSLEYCDGKPVEHAYEWGWFAGDGHLDTGRPMAVVQQPEYKVLDTMMVTAVYPEQMQAGGTVPFRRISLKNIIPLDTARILRDASAGLPDEILGMDTASIAEFMAGWIDTDGSVSHQPATDNIVLYGTERKLRDAQILLRRIGVDHASLRLFAPKGSVTNKGMRTRDLWRILIPSYEVAVIPTRLKVAPRCGSRFKVNNRHPDGRNIDAARKQRIVSVEKIADSVPVYCLTEPEYHVSSFGNVLTKQCNLVETFPSNCDDLFDYLRTLKFAFLYAKTVTLLPVQWPESNEVMIRNRRIGTSMTGIAQFAEKHGWHELRRWQDTGYATIRAWDRLYSEWLGVRESIKVTTVKPSGTVSLLFGVTPGAHWPVERGFYLRRVRDIAGSPFVKAMEDAGYPVEPSVSDPDTTVVITLPVEGPDIRPEREVSVWEKASLAATCQRFWSDNAVSVTLTFREDEKDQIPAVLRAFDGQLKSVSFLPMAEGIYAQAPYQRVSKEEWDALRANIKPLDWDSLYGNAELPEAEGELFCSNDSCIVPT